MQVKTILNRLQKQPGYNKARVTTRTAFGFRTYRAMELALYHTLGALPEPETPHRFC
jgi:hypothetical protein